MPYEVFISYSKQDKITADAVCGTLEAKGVRCWIAPRDVEPGRDWSESIIEALNVCPVMVLVFSSHANESPHVRREVQRAFGKNVTVIPFRVENVKPVQSLEYYLGPVHWLDALTPPLDRYLQQLSGTVQRLLAGRPNPDSRGTTDTTAPPRSTDVPSPPPVPPADRAPVVDPPRPVAEPATTMASVSAAPAPRADDGAKRRSPVVTLGVCAIAALTIVGVVFALRWERSRPDANGWEEVAPAPDTNTLAHATETTPTNITVTTQQPALRADEPDGSQPVITVAPRTADGVDSSTGNLDAFLQQTGQTTPDESAPSVPPDAIWQALTNGKVVTIVNGRAVVQDATSPIALETTPPAGGGPSAGEEWTVPALNVDMIYVAAGTFVMGSPPREKQRLPHEGPPTRVTLTQGFWLGRYEVTRDQWMSVMPLPTSIASEPVDEETPIVMITWTGAMEFCQALTAHERAANRLPDGYVYTLPTEAQWEYACRAGTTTPFHTGERLGSALANFHGTEPYGGAPVGNSYEGPIPVGNFPGNAWGFYDMHGNVWEWTSSGYATTYPGGNIDDYALPAVGDVRVMRGGSWQDAGWSCRSAMRATADANVGADSCGFRLALAPAR